MTSDRVMRLLEQHYDSTAERLEPSPALAAQILDIPFHYPARAGARERLVPRAVALAVAAVLLIGLLVAALAVGLRPAPTPGPAAVALTTFGDLGMIELSLDGMAGEPLNDCTECGPVVLDAAWNDDGTRLAYVTGCAGRCESPEPGFEGFGIWVRDLASGQSNLVHPHAGALGVVGDVPLQAGFLAVDWSPDGTRIVYGRPGNGVGILDLATGRTTRLSRYGADGVSWSPDGTTIAFSMAGGAVFTVPADGSAEPTRIADGSQPDWSPDGRRIAYRTGCEIRTMAADGGDQRVVATFDEGTWGNPSQPSCVPPVATIASLGPVWSPDGAHLAAVFADRLYVLDADGGDARIVQDPIIRGIGGIGVGVEWQPESRP